MFVLRSEHGRLPIYLRSTLKNIEKNDCKGKTGGISSRPLVVLTAGGKLWFRTKSCDWKISLFLDNRRNDDARRVQRVLTFLIRRRATFMLIKIYSILFFKCWIPIGRIFLRFSLWILMHAAIFLLFFNYRLSGDLLIHTVSCCSFCTDVSSIKEDFIK